MEGEFGFGDGEVFEAAPAKAEAQVEPVAGLPKHTMLLAVVIAAVMNFSEIIVNQVQNPYSVVDGILNTSTAFNTVCAVFALGAGLFGALKRNRSAMILSFAFSCTTAAALRFDERRVAAPHEVLRICVVIVNLFSAWCSMITSEQTQRETVAKGTQSRFLFSADVLDRFVVPGLAVVQLICGIVGLVLVQKMYSFVPNLLSPVDETEGKTKYMLQLGCSVVFIWNIVTAVLAFFSITTVGDKFGRGLLVAVASSALTGIALGFQILRYFPGLIQYWDMLGDCPILAQSSGLDSKAEETNIMAMMAVMIVSWLCNAAQVWSSWILSEERQESGGAGGTRMGGDTSMSNASQTYHRWNVRTAILQFGLASAAFFRFLALRRDETAYPDSIGVTFQTVLPQEGDDFADIDWSKGMIEKKYGALLSALTTASCCISVLKGQHGKFRDMLLTAGALAAFLCTTIGFNNLLYSMAESKYGSTIYEHHKPGFDVRNLNTSSSGTRTGATFDCALIDLSGPGFDDLEPLMGDFINHEELQAVFNLGPYNILRWGTYCPQGYSAYQDLEATLAAGMVSGDMMAMAMNMQAPLATMAAAAVQCHDASAGIAQKNGFGDGTKGFYLPPMYMEYSESEGDTIWSWDALNCAILGVAIIQQFLALAMSEANGLGSEWSLNRGAANLVASE